MSANISMKRFTPEEFKKLTQEKVNELMDKNIPFTVSNMFSFDYGFYYCPVAKRLYNKDNKPVHLTKLQNRFLETLIERPSEYLDYEVFKEKVWTGKDMSIFTLRNIVNQIREKTYSEIIINKSNFGYMVKQNH